MGYGITTTTTLGQDEAIEATRAALAEVGFGVLTEIDLAATLQAKIGAEIEPYMILGACRPPLAHAAVTADVSIGLLLPCNVVVRQCEGSTIVEALDPQVMVEMTDTDAFADIAADARDRLERALAAVGQR